MSSFGFAMGNKEDEELAALMLARAWGNHAGQSRRVKRQIRKQNFLLNNPVSATEIAEKVVKEKAAEIAADAFKQTGSNGGLKGSKTRKPQWHKRALILESDFRKNQPRQYSKAPLNVRS